MYKEKNDASCENPTFVPTNEPALSWFYIPTLNSENANGRICTAYEYFLRLPLSVTPIRILPVNEALRNLGHIQFIAKYSSIYTKNCLGHKHKTFLRSWRKVSSTTFITKNFAKIEDKKVLWKIRSKNLTAGVSWFTDFVNVMCCCFFLFVLFCCFTSQVNSYGHCGTVSSPNHTFSWAGLNKRLTSNSCTYFCL